MYYMYIDDGPGQMHMREELLSGNALWSLIIVKHHFQAAKPYYNVMECNAMQRNRVSRASVQVCKCMFVCHAYSLDMREWDGGGVCVYVEWRVRGVG